MLNQFLSTEISQLPAADDVVVNTVNPGLCVSELRREFNPIVGYAVELFSFVSLLVLVFSMLIDYLYMQIYLGFDGTND